MYGISVTLEELLSLRRVANQIYLPTPRTSSCSAHGNYRSPFRGRGMNFVENRIYQPGDDIRAINWAVTARTGRPHTKIYQQERERPVYLILDFNYSMYFGTKTAFKSVIAARAASLIAWAALRNGDRIGALLVKDHCHILPPAHSKRNLLELLKTVVSFTQINPGHPIDMRQSLAKLKTNLKSGSLIYFLSDFYCLNEDVKTELQYLAKRHEVTNIFIYDPLEKTPPEKGKYLFHDYHHPESLLLDTQSKEICTQYNFIFNARLEELKKLTFATGIKLVELATNQDLIKTIRQIFHRKVG